jgi:hypothetical protein
LICPFALVHYACRFVSRVNPLTNDQHAILATETFKPQQFAQQLSLDMSVGWGLSRSNLIILLFIIFLLQFQLFNCLFVHIIVVIVRFKEIGDNHYSSSVFSSWQWA